MASSNMISALGAGSGIDIKSLAENLVDAERAPQKERINAKLTQSQARISGYGALKYALSEFRTAVEKLNDASDFGVPKASSSQAQSVGVAASATARPGSYALEVSQLARAQRSVSMGFAAASTPLNGGAAFSLSLSVNGGAASSIPVPAGKDTPEGVVSAINASGLGLQAQLIRTGEGSLPYSIIVTGQEGAAKSFTLASSLPGVRFSDPATSIGTPLASDTDALNGGRAFDLSIAVNGRAPQAVAVTDDTPAGIAAAINGAGLGLSASLVATGDADLPHALVVTAQDGSVKNFSVGSPLAGLGFRGALADAADARLKVNGLAVTRPGNAISDVIAGTTLNLLATTNGEAKVDITQDTQAVKQNIQALVQAYNDLDTSLGILTDPKSEVEGLGGSLAGESLVRSIRNQIRGVLTAVSRTPGTDIRAARDVGLSFDRNGKLTLDEARLDKALQNNLPDVARMFSAGTNNKSLYSAGPAGVAGDLVVAVDKLTRTTGLVAKQTDMATRDVTRYKDQLKALEARMSKLQERYLSQFGAMESIVGNAKDTRSSLSSTFAGMSNAYKN